MAEGLNKRELWKMVSDPSVDEMTRNQLKAVLTALGVEEPTKERTPKDPKTKPRAGEEYFLHWEISCELCGSVRHMFWKMRRIPDDEILQSEPVNPQDYEFMPWVNEKKKSATCDRCLTYLEGKPHNEVCMMFIEYRIKVTVPVF